MSNAPAPQIPFPDNRTPRKDTAPVDASPLDAGIGATDRSASEPEPWPRAGAAQGLPVTGPELDAARTSTRPQATTTWPSHAPAQALDGPVGPKTGGEPLRGTRRGDSSTKGAPATAGASVTPTTRRPSGLVRRQVRVSIGTAARIRLLAAALDTPVEQALLHAVPTYLAGEQPLHRYPTVRKAALPGIGDESTVTIALPPEGWAAVRRRAKSEGVRTAAVLDAAVYPYLGTLRRIVASTEDSATHAQHSANGERPPPR